MCYHWRRMRLFTPALATLLAVARPVPATSIPAPCLLKATVSPDVFVASSMASTCDEALSPVPLASAAAPVDAPSAAPDPRLTAAIEGVIARDEKMRSAHWGFVIADDKGNVVYQRDAERLFNPASCMKLITGAAATAALGADKTFQTAIVTTGQVDAAGVLRGDLHLVGGGDPSLQTADLEAAVKRLGIKRVEGKVLVDDHAFDDARLGTGWSWNNFSAYYSAESDALTVDEGCALVRVSRSGAVAEPDTGYLTFDNHATAGAETRLDVDRRLGTNVITIDGTVSAPSSTWVTVHDPALYAGNVLKWLCKKSGIEVTGGVERAVAPTGARTLWQHASAPLAQLERQMLKESDNVYAESLFRALAGGSSAQAPDREAQLLHIDEAHQIVDGSGLSRQDLVSPATLRNVVAQYYRDAASRDLLPIAGVDGTLKRRMPSLQGRVSAKTGTLDNVSSLAGWLTLKDGRRYSFAWMCNGYPGAGVKATEDALMTAVDGALSRAAAPAPQG